MVRAARGRAGPQHWCSVLNCHGVYFNMPETAANVGEPSKGWLVCRVLQEALWVKVRLYCWALSRLSLGEVGQQVLPQLRD